MWTLQHPTILLAMSFRPNIRMVVPPQHVKLVKERP